MGAPKPGHWRVYFEVARRGFKRQSAYRAAALAASATNCFFGVMRASVLMAVWRSRPGLAGYDLTDVVTYTFVAQALIAPAAVFGGDLGLASRIRTGDVVIDLYRPVDFQAWWIASDAGRAAYALVWRAVGPLAVGSWFFTVDYPSVGQIPYLAVSIGLAIVVSFGLRYLVELVSFWTLDEKGMAAVSVYCAIFFSGMIVPLRLLPGWLRVFAEASPWSAVVQVPVDVFLEQHRGLGALGPMALQAGWAAVLLLAGRALTVASRQRVVVQGG